MKRGGSGTQKTQIWMGIQILFYRGFKITKSYENTQFSIYLNGNIYIKVEEYMNFHSACLKFCFPNVFCYHLFLQIGHG